MSNKKERIEKLARALMDIGVSLRDSTGATAGSEWDEACHLAASLMDAYKRETGKELCDEEIEDYSGEGGSGLGQDEPKPPHGQIAA